VSWLPLVARTAGIDIRSSVLAVSAWNLGGIAGCYVIGRLRNRYGPVKPIALAYGLAPWLLGCSGVGSSGLELLVSAWWGDARSRGADVIIGLSASFYDTSLRATGLAGRWRRRVGAVVGPLIVEY